MADLTTIGRLLYWSYANLSMAHAAIADGASCYTRRHHIIRNRVFQGLLRGTVHMRPLAEEARLALVLPRICCYCGAEETLTADHLLPRHAGGAHSADNLVWACRSCNSSKGCKDLLVWFASRDLFPPLLLLRRYLKLAAGLSQEMGILDTAIELAPAVPFSLSAVPTRYPSPVLLCLWVVPLSTTKV